MLSQQKPPEGGHSIRRWARLGWSVGLLVLWQDTFSLSPLEACLLSHSCRYLGAV